MANIPKDPIIGQASEFEKHLRKQEELVRDSKGKGPTRYYANRKPEWAAGAHDEDGDDGFTGAFDQQQPQQHQQPLSQITIGSVTAAEGSSSGGVPRERARRREKVAPSVVSAGGNEPGSIANEVSDPRLRRLLRNEIKKAVKEEPPNDSSGSGAGESNTSSSSRRGRRQRIKAEIIQHQKDLEVQEKTQVQAQDAATSSSQVIMKNEEDNDPVRNDNNDGIPHHLTRKELHNAIKMRELKPSQEAGTDRGHYNSNRAEPISGSSNNKESVTIKTEKVESKGKDDDDDDNDEEEEEDDDDEEEEEENEWPEMMVPAFVPREERILPKIEESLKREEEYFRQSEIDRVKKNRKKERNLLCYTNPSYGLFLFLLLLWFCDRKKEVKKRPGRGSKTSTQ